MSQSGRNIGVCREKGNEIITLIRERHGRHCVSSRSAVDGDDMQLGKQLAKFQTALLVLELASLLGIRDGDSFL